MQRFKKLLLSGFLCSTLVGAAQKNVVVLQDVTITENRVAQAPTYTTENRTLDVLHIDLELHLDWQKHALLGKADIFLKPYFYPIDTAVLDAKGFKIHEVALVDGGLKKPLVYRNDGLQLHIALGKTATREDVLHLFIDYTALPDSLEIKGGAAIRDAKGFYFIDSAEGKMQQFWTQGEPESNSSWLPCVDKPYEKMTHRIGLTVPSDWLTLGNGALEFRTRNGDGTHTDYWKMDQPHAPYLIMLAGGKFDTLGTQWQGKPVRYFVEPQWKSSAERIFGNTPEMLSFFSQMLGVTYPWHKYDQIVVRDYVSGAMENTTATVHGEFLYTTPRGYADETFEDVISHELFHQWFGDLVTCESWAQLPLNESFATYGEVLWKQYKYGDDDADFHRLADLNAYLNEFAWGKAEKMIRLDYTLPLEMFDSHSYAKGGRILHMLRAVVGDEAFFAALKKYLTDYAYKTAEIENLRQAFEETTGQDLRWFFDQWFYQPGHPQLTIKPGFNREKWVATLTVTQTQDLTLYPIYKLPVAIDVYTRAGKKRHAVEVNAQTQTFEFAVDTEPKLIKFDARNELLAEIKVEQTDANWLNQLGNNKQALDRYLAAKHLLGTRKATILTTVASIALDDTYHKVRLLALQSADGWDEAGKKKLEGKVEKLLEDPNPHVRAAAITVWSEIYKKKDEKLYSKNLDYISLAVNEAALYALASVNPAKAMAFVNDSMYAPASLWAEICLPTLLDFGTTADIKRADAVMQQKGGEAALEWYYSLANSFYRGGEAGRTMVDILVTRAEKEPGTPPSYYAYAFLKDGIYEAEARAETAATEEGKEVEEIAKYARQKLDVITVYDADRTEGK
jgi:aminopeptidase N